MSNTTSNTPGSPFQKVITAGYELAIANISRAASAVGEKRNYNLQAGGEYELWPFSTIEWVASEGKYRARAILRHKASGNNVVINSWHQDYSDAERPIAQLAEVFAGVASRRVYNIFGETMEVHTSDIGGGHHITVTEVQGLIWSMQQLQNP